MPANVLTAPPSTAFRIVDVPDLFRQVAGQRGSKGAFVGSNENESPWVPFGDDELAQFVQTVDVWWFIDHYESYCREHGIPVNPQLYI
ncbi:hypothetical protein [Paraburkholderia silvatlantica]|uniref:hypothetical protein n=1 Tax=Paraburkholderia silvatlantica TaxID=321895 RepID=UPI003751E105